MALIDKYNRADQQRYVGLKNAFDTIRAFAEPSCNPEQFKAFKELEKHLIRVYKPEEKIKP